MSLKSIIAAIGNFFEKLFINTREDFNNLPVEQQEAIIQAVNVAQTIKEFYAKGEQFIVGLVAQKAHISEDVARGVILSVGKDLGIDTGHISDVLNHIADKAQNAVTDNQWNALWDNVAKFAASWLSTGKADWLTLGLGVVQFAYLHFIKGVK